MTVPWEVLVFRLVEALVLGAGVAGIYRLTRQPANVTPTFPATLVLLSVLIAIVTQVIGNNAARAFSLVGTLSIVRFRTAVRDTKDTAFVIFAVVMGMAIGAGQSVVACCGMLAVGVAAGLFRDRVARPLSAGREMVLLVRIGWSPDLESRINDILWKYTGKIETMSLSTARNGSAMEISFRIQLPEDASLTRLLGELTRLEGVQYVDLRPESQEG